MKKIILSLAFVLALISSFAQNDRALLNELMSQDTSAVRELALYPESVRNHILEASKYPELIVRINSMQKESGESFRTRIAHLSKNEQEKLWNLSRYPGLISKLAEGKDKTPEEVNKILEPWPAEIHETAISFEKNKHGLLTEINTLNKQLESDFGSLIRDYPEITRNSFRELLKYPEAMNILGENMKTTVVLGGISKSNPQMLKHSLDSLGAALAEKNARDLEEWKKGLNENPEAMKEMQSSAKEYAKEQGYQEEDLVVRDERVVVNYVVYPYHYWFGYPWWYDQPYWYPYAYWHHWGFYVRPSGAVVIINLPSFWYTHWHFHHHRHFYNYPYFTDYSIKHYYGRRGSRKGFHRGVGEWVRENESMLPRNYLSEPEGRPYRIKELGRLNEEYIKQAAEDPAKKVTREEYIRKALGTYPPAQSKPEVEPSTEPKPGPQKPAPVTQPSADEEPQPAEERPARPRPAPQAEPKPAPPADVEPGKKPEPRPVPGTDDQLKPEKRPAEKPRPVPKQPPAKAQPQPERQKPVPAPSQKQPTKPAPDNK